MTILCVKDVFILLYFDNQNNVASKLKNVRRKRMVKKHEKNKAKECTEIMERFAH